MNNRIKIPWYRRNIRRPKIEDMEFNSAEISFPKFPPLIRTPNPITEPVRQPATQPATEPETEPIRSPFMIPEPFPFPFPKPGVYNPNNPFPNPIPTPVPNPKEDKPYIPNPNPIPQPLFSEEQQSWIDNFVKQITVVATVTGIGTKKIFDHVANYDFKNKGLGEFRRETADEFGLVAATLLTVGILGKELANLWGKRATMMFTPPIILDEDFFNENFANKKYEI